MAKQKRQSIKDGDMLIMVGGPKNGQYHPVNFVLPFLNGGLPPSSISFGTGEQQIFYCLDKKNRCWQFTL